MLLCQSSILKGLPTILVVIGLASSSRITSENEIDPITYFKQFGYLERVSYSNDRMITTEKLAETTREFQRFFGLNPTGELDDETKQIMSAPRCGMADKNPARSNNGLASYTEQHSRWKVKHLTYKIKNQPSNPHTYLTPTQVRSEIKRAFDLWSQHTDLTFELKETGPVHIEIVFGPDNHGCKESFGGPRVLAHAFFPIYSGDAHFNDANTFTMNIEDDYSYSLFIVAAHEFGHSLGLEHSTVRMALMYPTYQKFTQFSALHADDIEGIQAIYGKKTERTFPSIPSIPPSTSGPKSSVPPSRIAIPNPPDICGNPKVDAMFNSADGQTYAFKGAHYFLFAENSVAKGYPKPISESWPALPGEIDAALTLTNGKTYFFKGSQCWRYDKHELDNGFPKQINDQFPGIPNNLDAAIIWSTGVMFFKENNFWYFDPSATPHVHPQYPKPISDWHGVPNNLNAAVQYPGGGYTYFFKDDKFYRLNNGNIQVEDSYPKSTGKVWFDCDSSTLDKMYTDSQSSGKITTDTEGFYYQYT